MEAYPDIRPSTESLTFCSENVLVNNSEEFVDQVSLVILSGHCLIGQLGTHSHHLRPP